MRIEPVELFGYVAHLAIWISLTLWMKSQGVPIFIAIPAAFFFGFILLFALMIPIGLLINWLLDRKW
ncbi:hypothetical protein C5Y96_05085 [Blastopirellula marina]|uniref:DUF4281 domain-containing protein n=1 Tax=Blastopirellula marina TaxID=124 RepID=A0A2S8G513_9BACT|nr:hypothetical protein C5Y96_05085 [Blastopirellula marina]RCS55542.1 hypothetical protein DTL36_05095 [Bremerella cremea]